ncbi:class I SAM-dependent methyltransferase [Amorphoplanes digitatis]|uniref:Putative nicotinamide N-methyase n=1 Tax=Actinoplanes digitatis TaxID=1868 RepID=A0A7W7I437_9ACTN|nr:50S ribosomal protein L11 methyltransferase [Actinoplanes digitatis]MBB4766061.1 putative nicotinamide N-methyase [Actinoplanes digitatis]GID97911.1 50S ribosomal protein L11 methyltransferase [Actinoplanes digitatis]
MHTTLLPVPLAPEISLHLADGRVGLFDENGGAFSSDVPPPFWLFVWAGGQALARYVLDHPEIVRGRTVLDIATGSGVAAIAAARAGAARVTALDVDPRAAQAAARNAAANDAAVDTRVADVAQADSTAEVILAGDVFYTRGVADRMAARLRRAGREGARVLVGDPGRGFFPERLFARVAEYVVPVPAALEETESLVTGVWELRTRATTTG